MKRRKSLAGVWEEQPQEILDKVVKDASLYTAMETPGSLQSSHLFPPFSGDLVLLALPDAINPYDLINSEVVVGGRKESVVMGGGQKYRMATYPANPDNNNLPSVFLPDQNGKLTKVSTEIKGCLVVKGVVEERKEDRKNCVDIDALRSARYETPKELQKRDFFTKTKTREVMMKIEKPVKRKKKNSDINTTLDNSRQSSEEVQSPGKKKKSKHVSPDSKESSENSLRSEELGYNIKKKIKKENSEVGIGNVSSVSLRGKKKNKEKGTVKT